MTAVTLNIPVDVQRRHTSPREPISDQLTLTGTASKAALAPSSQLHYLLFHMLQR